MSEQKPLSMEQGITLQLYMEGLRSEYRPTPNQNDYTDMDMQPDENGPYYRREGGGYGDWFSEIFQPHNRPRRGQDQVVPRAFPTTVMWTPDGPRTTRNEVPQTEAVEEPEPTTMPQVQRYRCITPYPSLLIRAYKKEAREILEELFKA